jgi:hypothetical protein
MKTLFVQAPSSDGFDGGAGSRCQARREVRSFWYPAWLAQPAALIADSRVPGLPGETRGTIEKAIGYAKEIVREMLMSWEMMKRWLREGVEFFHFLRARTA